MFHNNSNFKDHISAVHQKIKKFGCEICGKHFFRKTNLNRHSTVHSDVKDQKCHMCDKVFSCKGYLRKHMQIILWKNPE